MKVLKNDRAFTLIEMMIVLLVISVLLIITIPNITKHNSNINNKGCAAYLKMVESQIQAYQIDKKEKPASLDVLIKEGYLKEGEAACPDGTEVYIDSAGEVKKKTK